jgi:ubiquinone/menaquinone biosynthesis C-methylase UbiE
MTKNGMMSENYENHLALADLHYARAVGTAPEMESSKAVAKFVKKVINENDTIADIGFSSGHYLRSLRQQISTDFKYVGVEFTELFYNKAKLAWSGDSNVTFKQGSIFEIPLTDKSVDVTFCSNLLMHVPTIVKPLSELLRITKKTLIIRTYIGYKSFKIQEVKNNSFWSDTLITPEDEFDDLGNPRLFEYENIWSKEYFESTLKRFSPNAKVTFTKDTFYDPKAIDYTAENEGLPNPTTTIDGKQFFDYIMLPYHFVQIDL